MDNWTREIGQPVSFAARGALEITYRFLQMLPTPLRYIGMSDGSDTIRYAALSALRRAFGAVARQQSGADCVTINAPIVVGGQQPFSRLRMPSKT
jgi:hypothetical protein